MSLRVLQFSDLHLDSCAAGTRLALTRGEREQRAADARLAVTRALSLVRTQRAQLVLVPGDLWDDEAISADSVAFLGEAFAEIAPVPVFIAPGNRDFYAPGSGYDPDFLVSRGRSAWPDNVHVFRDARFETVEVPTLPGVTVTGRAFHADVATSERLLAGRITRPRAELALLVFHGSRLGHEAGKELITAPFSDAELLGQGFAYAAIGHYHEPSQIEDARGRVRSAYAGSLVWRGLDETGPRGALLADVDAGGVVPGSLAFVETDGRRIVRVAADVSGATDAETARRRVRAAVEASDARPQDLLWVEAHGRYPRATAPPTGSDFLHGYFATRVAWQLEPDRDVEAFISADPRAIDARFAHEIEQRLARATGARERALLRQALHIGLDALARGHVQVRPQRFDDGGVEA